MSEAAERTTGPAPDGYHGLPALKPSPWSAKVPAYVALVGAGGAAQILAALARWGAGPGSRSIVRNGRLIALGTAIAGAPLLIADLKTPQRFLNMLRIWRPTSPMSFGSFTLTGFGAASALAVAGDLVRGRRGRLSRAARTAGEVAQAPAALLGAGVATYTGALLSATSVPLWQSAPGLLTARFAASAFASGAAALSIAEHAMGDRHGNSRRLGAIALAATAVGLVLARACDRALRRDAVDGPLRSTPEGALYSAGAKVIGQMLPIALLGTNAVARSYTGQFLKPLFKRGGAKAEMAPPKKRARAAE